VKFVVHGRCGLIHRRGVVLSNFYKLPCECGLVVPIKKSQSGRQVTCRCGKTLDVPLMSAISNLECFSNREILQFEKKSTLRNQNSHKAFRARPIVLTIGILLILVSSSVLYFTTKNKPQIYDVIFMRTRYSALGRDDIGRDSLPIDERDRLLLICYNPYLPEDRIRGHMTPLTPEYFDHMTPDHLMRIHDALKSGPELSSNFTEKYEKLLLNYKARIVISIVFLAGSVFITIVGFCLPKKPVDLGERGGETWEE